MEGRGRGKLLLWHTVIKTIVWFSFAAILIGAQ
jgi:hypothetical protein